jgi:hypothetical protein
LVAPGQSERRETLPIAALEREMCIACSADSTGGRGSRSSSRPDLEDREDPLAVANILTERQG